MSNSPSPYELTQNKYGYVFTTIWHLCYSIYFSEYYLQTPYGEEIVVTSLSFDRDGKCGLFDPRIQTTLAVAIERFFQRNPLEAIVFTCLMVDGRSQSRKRIFARWAREGDGSIERYSCPAACEINGYHSSMLIRADHPDKYALVDAFRYSHELWLKQ